MRVIQDELYSKLATLVAMSTQRPEIIHCHHHAAFSIATKLRHLTGARVVTTVHYLKSGTNITGQRFPSYVYHEEEEMCRRSDEVIAVSRWMKREILQKFGIPSSRVTVVHGGVEQQLPVDQAATSGWRSFLASSAEQIVLYVGRMSPEKGMSLLLEAAARVCSILPNTSFAIAGGHPSEIDHFHEKAAKYQVLRDKVHFLGWLGERQLAELRSVADVAVVPSILETFGYSALEAMAAALPVVGTRVGGLPEVVRHNRTGLLVSYQGDVERWNENASHLASALIRVLENRSLRERLGRLGQNLAMKRFSLERMASDTAKVYSQAVGVQGNT